MDAIRLCARQWRKSLALFVMLCGGLAVHVTPAHAVAGTRLICTGSYVPTSPQYWFSCSTASSTQAAAKSCSIGQWQVVVWFTVGLDYANWNNASGTQTQYRQDPVTKLWTYKMRGIPCKLNPFWQPPYQQ
jgi:hypothetical protein